MIDKSSIILQKCANARFVEVCEMHYLENGVKKRWEVVKSNDSVSILINNLDSAKLIIVRQFRPAVFLRNNDGYMFELCAGLVDKEGKSLEQIAREEVLEECGYEAKDLQKIGEFYSSVGTSGSKQSVFYAEVRNADKKTRGGGVDDEFIEIVEVAHSEVLDFLKTPNITPSLGFAFMWFLQNIESSANSASCGDFLGSASARFVNEPKSSISSLALHNPKNSSTILEFASCKEIAESNADSADSQNLGENNPRVSANLESRPLRGAKNRNQASSSARADFLLEADKRGSPPKSEKRQLLARRGSGEGGAALLREKTNEFNSKGGAESVKESQGGLPRSHSLARNDENLDSSLRLRSAQNDKIKAENDNLGLVSANSQKLVKNNLARSANPLKSFCYFWLKPKVESPLTLNPNLPNSADSATRAKIAESNINL